MNKKSLILDVDKGKYNLSLLMDILRSYSIIFHQQRSAQNVPNVYMEDEIILKHRSMFKIKSIEFSNSRFFGAIATIPAEVSVTSTFDVSLTFLLIMTLTFAYWNCVFAVGKNSSLSCVVCPLTYLSDQLTLIFLF